MLRRLILPFVAVVIVVALGVGAYWGISYYRQSRVYASLPSIIVGGANPAPEAPITYTAADPIGPLTVISLQNSILVLKSNAPATTSPNATTTFTYHIPSNVQVYSLASEGQKGKSLQDITPGIQLKIYPAKEDPAMALYIAFERDPSLVLPLDAPNKAIAGVVTAVSANSVTLQPADGSLVTITISPTTKIATTVFPGQIGRPLTVGEHVAANGVSTSGGVTTALQLILGPIPPPDLQK